MRLFRLNPGLTALSRSNPHNEARTGRPRTEAHRRQTPLEVSVPPRTRSGLRPRTTKRSVTAFDQNASEGRAALQGPSSQRLDKTTGLKRRSYHGTEPVGSGGMSICVKAERHRGSAARISWRPDPLTAQRSSAALLVIFQDANHCESRGGEEGQRSCQPKGKFI